MTVWERRKVSRAFLPLLLLFLLGALPAQAQVPTEVARWSAQIVPNSVAVGEQATLRVSVDLDPDWKLYALDTPPPSPKLLLSARADQAVTIGAFDQPDPADEVDPFLEVTVRIFRDQDGVFEAPIRASAPGTYTVATDIRFTVCDKSICLPPTRHTVEAMFVVGAGGLAAPAPDKAEPNGVVPDLGAGSTSLFEPGPTEASPSLERADETAAMRAGLGSEGGLWGFLALAVAAGLGALLMPCVYPMLPLTVSFFTNQGGSRARATRLALLYGLSIVATFTLLGLVLAAVVGAAGAQAVAANPWVNLFVASVFVLFGLSLLGVFELKLPSALVNASARGESRGGVAGVLFMGLTLTLVSFSCTVPFVGGLLAATVGGDWLRPVVGMLAFSVTFALPFVAFALFPRALARLPRSGTWMNTFKITLGFVELVAALKFLSNADLVWGWGILTRPLAIAVSAVLLALCGLFLIGLIGIGDEPKPQSVGAGRLLSASAFLAAALYLIPGLWGANLGLFDAYLPPRSAADFSVVAASAPASGSSAHADWPRGLGGLQTASQQAASQGRMVFIDFTGYTCTNCRAMESTVFPLADVQAALAAYVPVALYTDAAGDGPAMSRFQLEQTATVALPTYAIYDPATERVIAHTSGMQSAEEFAAFLRRYAG